jgi:hypothetical protein
VTATNVKTHARPVSVAVAISAVWLAVFAGSASAQSYWGSGSSYGGYSGYSSYGYSSYGYGSNSNSTYVSGYTRSNGTYVSGYYRTAPNSTVYDNYSYRGNYNPYTGQYGTRSYSTYWGR